jgi:hypothetical protein
LSVFLSVYRSASLLKRVQKYSVLYYKPNLFASFFNII